VHPARPSDVTSKHKPTDFMRVMIGILGATAEN
jgi:hypothetical protein